MFRGQIPVVLSIYCAVHYICLLIFFFSIIQKIWDWHVKVKPPVISFDRAVWDTRAWVFTSAQYVQTRLKNLRLWWRQGANDSSSIYQGKTHWLTDWLIWGTSLLEFLQIYLTKNQVWCNVAIIFTLHGNFHKNLAWWVNIFIGKILCDVAELECWKQKENKNKISLNIGSLIFFIHTCMSGIFRIFYTLSIFGIMILSLYIY